jgi:tetratricopeptide (TPR) repeat protein
MRWVRAAGVAGAVAAAFLGVAGGAAKSVDDAAGRAAQLRAHGDYGAACALYRQVAAHTGFVYVLARGTVTDAPREEQRTMLAWAKALAGSGQFDEALRLAERVDDPRLRSERDREQASLLLDGARAAAAAGDYQRAVLRVEQLQRLLPASNAASQTPSLLPGYEVGEANALISDGHGADAVVLLDSVAEQGGSARSAASQMLPAALLAAAQEELRKQSYVEANESLHRLVSTYGTSSAARAARSLLAARQPVAGTLTTHGGAPVTGQIRLSSNFRQLGNGYVTSGPFYYSHTDPSGDFTVDGVPQGGPYVLEVFHNGDWTTLVDPASGRPADPVRVNSPAPVDLTFIVLPA